MLEASREQNLYDEVLDVIFEKTSLWSQPNNEKPELMGILKEVSGLDIMKLKTDMKSPKNI